MLSLFTHISSLQFWLSLRDESHWIAAGMGVYAMENMFHKFLLGYEEAKTQR